MDTRRKMVMAALQLLESEGLSQFSTRAVGAIAKVTPPTLYHHFGSADGLLSAAIGEAFEQFIASRKAAVKSADVLTALREGWDDYVRFAATRPRLYSAMLARVLQGVDIPAARQGYAMLMERIKALEAERGLLMPPEAAAQIVWASASAAALLYTAELGGTGEPDPEVVAALREGAIGQIIARQENRR